MPRLETFGLDVLFYDDGFFSWWRMKVPMIDDYQYTGMDFRNDDDLILLDGAQWDATGMSLKELS